MKISAAEMEGLRKKERGDETQFIINSQFAIICLNYVLFYDSSEGNCSFDALLCQNWSFSPPNDPTLRITLLSTEICWICWSELFFLSYFDRFARILENQWKWDK